MNFRFQQKVYNGCHDLLQKAMSFNNFAIVSIKENDYRIHFWYISKDEFINLLKHADLRKKLEHYRLKVFFITYKRCINKF